MLPSRMHARTGLVVITGANRGIGLGLCEAYDREKVDVLAVCRSASYALNSLGVPIVSGARWHAGRVHEATLRQHPCIGCWPFVCTLASSRTGMQYCQQAVAGIDVTQVDAWEGVRKAVAARPIDVLILNAGILIKDELADLSCNQNSLLEQVSSLWPSSLWCADALMAGMPLIGCCAAQRSSA